MQDLVIIGGGPAGCSAGVYAARKELTTTLVTAEFGGQSIVSPEIYNWIGDKAISGDTLAKNLEAHVRDYQDRDYFSIIDNGKVTNITKSADHFRASNRNTLMVLNPISKLKRFLVASGSRRRQLDVPGAAEFEHKGVVYCASCDGTIIFRTRCCRYWWW